MTEADVGDAVGHERRHAAAGVEGCVLAERHVTSRAQASLTDANAQTASNRPDRRVPCGTVAPARSCKRRPARIRCRSSCSRRRTGLRRKRRSDRRDVLSTPPPMVTSAPERCCCWARPDPIVDVVVDRAGLPVDEPESEAEVRHEVRERNPQTKARRDLEDTGARRAHRRQRSHRSEARSSP